MAKGRGIFITFEGPEGGGKTTQAARLARRLRAAGFRVVRLHEPGGTGVGEAVRGMVQHGTAGRTIHPECELLLFAAARAQLVREVIRPALQRGACVLCDRFADSTTAYQGYGRGLDLALVRRVNDYATGGTLPDLTLLLDLEPGTGLARLRKRNRRRHPLDRMEEAGPAFHRRVRAGYARIAAREPRRVRRIAADRDPDAVEEAVWRAVRPRIRRRVRR